MWNKIATSMEHEFEFKDWNAAIQFVNKISVMAEKLNHHPDVFIHGWNKVKVMTTTHDAGGLTEKDSTLVLEINKIYENFK